MIRNNLDVASETMIDLIMCAPGHSVLTLMVKPHEKVKKIDCLFPSINMMYIYDGTELIKEQTFNFYGIKERVTIMCLPWSNTEFSDWRNRKSDWDELSFRIKGFLDPNLIHANARLRDIQMLKWNRKSPKKLYDSYQNYFGKFEKVDEHLFKTILKEPKSCPSNDPLPICWIED